VIAAIAIMPRARSALDHLERANRPVVIVPQVLYEYWVVATRPIVSNGFGLTTTEADQAISKWSSVYRLLLDERGVFTHWRDLVKRHEVKGKPAHDARLIAAMQRHGIRSILTFNKADFTRFSTVSAYTPAEIVAVNVSEQGL
jgi:predicted nucleic acid-binding protein